MVKATGLSRIEFNMSEFEKSESSNNKYSAVGQETSRWERTQREDQIVHWVAKFCDLRPFHPRYDFI